MRSDWQPVYDSRLRRAREAVLKAEDHLGDIGGKERQAENLDDIRSQLRAIAEQLDQIWKRHYGSESWNQ